MVFIAPTTPIYNRSIPNSTLFFTGQNVAGEIVKLELDNNTWLDVDYLRVGLIITEELGGGEVKITRLYSQGNSKKVDGIVIKPFTTVGENETFTWTLSTEISRLDSTKQLAENQKGKELLIELLELITFYSNSLLDRSTDLNYIKAPMNTLSADINGILNNLGIYISSSLLDALTLRYLLVEIPAYIKKKHTYSLVHILSYVFNTSFSMVQLHTKNHKDYVIDVPVGEENDYMLSNHILLRHGAIRSTRMTPTEITRLFYDLAWISLVLYNVEYFQIYRSDFAYLLSSTTNYNSISYRYTLDPINP